MKISVIKARMQHLEDCNLALRRSKLGEVYFPTDEKALAALTEGISREQVFVAINEAEECLGFMWFVPNGAFHSYPYLHVIAIKEEYRGLGIGQELMRFFEKTAFTDHSKIFLVVADFNPDARRLYERLGYQQVGVLPGLYKEGVTEYLMMKTKESLPAFTMPVIPAELQWKNIPQDWKAASDGSLSILAGAGTDWFSDPAGDYFQDSAPAALFTPPDAEFILSARVTVGFVSTFDAGALQLRVDGERWAKLCFEYSPDQKPMIVSVVTRGKSDDCNSVALPGQVVHLRMAVTPQVIGLHYSTDGSYWTFIRYFTLGKTGILQAGFSAQSPTGQGCRATFSDIRYRPGRLKDYRNGE